MKSSKGISFTETFKHLLTSGHPYPSFVLYANKNERSHWKLDTPNLILQSLGQDFLPLTNDILVLHQNQIAQGPQTIQETVSTIHQFLATSPLRARKKVVWWTWEKPIPVNLQNKLLKLTEESGPNYIFLFWMFNTPGNLLPTLRSRVVPWKNIFGASEKNDTVALDFSSISSQSSFADFQEYWESQGLTEQRLLEWMAYHLNNQQRTASTPYLHLEKFGNLVEWINNSSQWNNPPLERRYMLFQFLKPLLAKG